ncbi:hypothetical protein J4E70_08710 [Pseudohalocynthiibacter aestuariivivens]|uniref:hypothetical protein n=1 Tax=Pseudohalocynthiibacter aestuariivivens TaxID=1591409 RepID=UPI001BD6AEA3|nr:hypothetical protein [Pseudohalocynthiibacter aestuariivivens]MBS9717024.1 hypothetical protein [Pseudohalocynthiibacter aestuariivivens]
MAASLIAFVCALTAASLFGWLFGKSEGSFSSRVKRQILVAVAVTFGIFMFLGSMNTVDVPLGDIVVRVLAIATTIGAAFGCAINVTFLWSQTETAEISDKG